VELGKIKSTLEVETGASWVEASLPEASWVTASLAKASLTVAELGERNY